MILDAQLAPDPMEHRMSNGMIWDRESNTEKPGAILKAWADVREAVGVVEQKRKPGMKFDTRASTDLIDKLNVACNKAGVLVYPSRGTATGGLLDTGGTSANIELVVVAQAIEDGSRLEFYGYGQGVDNQDKAGGKAGTYAFKQAVIQALLAGGSKMPKKDRVPDTDDDDNPVEGGPRPASPGKAPKPTFDSVKAAMEAAQDEAAYRSALEQLKAAQPADQVKLTDIARVARARCIPPVGIATTEGS
jgi:hypothetical protein